MCKDRVALVTGAAGSGMGRSIALTLAREGAKVVVNYRKSKENANAIVEHIRKRGGSATAIKADVFKPDECKNLVDKTIEDFGRVDICIVNPGAAWHPEPMDEMNPDAAIQDTSQEVAPLFQLMPLVLPGMYERRWGRLIGLSQHPTKQPPAYSYNVGKMARMQALLLARDQAWSKGVTVNVIAPGPVPEIKTLEEAIEYSDHGEIWQKRTTASPQDIAESVAFLCSEAGRYITGCIIPFLFNE